MPMYGGRYGGGMGYGMSPLDFVPGGAQTANIGEMYGMGQQHAQQMQDEQTMEQLRQGQLAEQTYQLSQQKASQEVDDALAKGEDSPEAQAAATKYPALYKQAQTAQQIQGMKTQAMQLALVGAQAKGFSDDLFGMPTKEDFITNYDKLQQKYPNLTFPAQSDFTGADGDAKYAQWRDGEQAKAGHAFKYTGQLTNLTADLIHAKTLEGASGGPLTDAATQALSDFKNNEHAKLVKTQAEAAKDAAASKPTTASGTDVKSAEDFISGDPDLKQITDPGQAGYLKQQLAQAGHAMVRNGQAPDLVSAFKQLKSGIQLSPTHSVLGINFGGKQVNALQSGSQGQKQQYPNDPGPGKRQKGQIYMVNGQPKKWGG